VCDVVKKCRDCKKLINNWVNGKGHRCGVEYCSACKIHHDINDPCYMHPVREIKDEKPKPDLFVFYDFESRQESSFKNQPGVRIHEPNLCVVQVACTLCLDQWQAQQPCDMCGMHELFSNTSR